MYIKFLYTYFYGSFCFKNLSNNLPISFTKMDTTFLWFLHKKKSDWFQSALEFISEKFL